MFNKKIDRTISLAAVSMLALAGAGTACTPGPAGVADRHAGLPRPTALGSARSDADYFPWLAGKSLHYSVRAARGPEVEEMDLVRTIAHVSPDGREATLMANWMHEGNPMDQEIVRLRVTPSALEAADPASGRFGPFLALPLQAGATARYRIPAPILTHRFLPAVAQNVVQTSSGRETVTVPAGRYDSLRVDFRFEGVLAGEPISSTATMWLASGVGEVRFAQTWVHRGERATMTRQLTEIE